MHLGDHVDRFVETHRATRTNAYLLDSELHALMTHAAVGQSKLDVRLARQFHYARRVE